MTRSAILLSLTAIFAVATTSQSQLVGYWNFESASNPAQDSSSLGNHGQLLGSACLTADAAVGTGALLLDGSGGFLRLYNCINGEFKGNFRHGKATFAAWIKLLPGAIAGTKTGLANLGCYGIPSRYPQQNGMSLSLTLFLSYPVSQQASPILVPLPAGTQLEQWHHLAITVDSTDIVGGYKVYLDGSVLGVYPMNGTCGNFIGLQRPCVGAAYDLPNNLWHYLSGTIDELRIYNEVLTLSQIRSLVCFGWNPADILADCSIDIRDLGVFAMAWLSSGSGMGPDLDGNDIVDINDFAAFSAAWLEKSE